MCLTFNLSRIEIFFGFLSPFFYYLFQQYERIFHKYSKIIFFLTQFSFLSQNPKSNQFKIIAQINPSNLNRSTSPISFLLHKIFQLNLANFHRLILSSEILVQQNRKRENTQRF